MYSWNRNPFSGVTVSANPPTSRTTGIVPYRRLYIWFRPQGSNCDGIRKMSAPPSITCASRSSKPIQAAIRSEKDNAQAYVDLGRYKLKEYISAKIRQTARALSASLFAPVTVQFGNFEMSSCDGMAVALRRYFKNNRTELRSSSILRTE